MSKGDYTKPEFAKEFEVRLSDALSPISDITIKAFGSFGQDNSYEFQLNSSLLGKNIMVINRGGRFSDLIDNELVFAYEDIEWMDTRNLCIWADDIREHSQMILLIVVAFFNENEAEFLRIAAANGLRDVDGP